MSSYNVIPVTMEISPTKAGVCVNQSSCNAVGNGGGALKDESMDSTDRLSTGRIACDAGDFRLE